MKYLRGFMMAWGNFSAIPCPYKKWHDDARRAMLCMLPLVGIVLAVITVAAWALLDLMGAPAILTGVLLTILYFCGTGFIHLDGYMDCSDAILSRRDLAERQRILKDSTVGAFAVVALAMMLLVFAASMTALAEEFTMQRACVLICIMSISRGIAATDVLNRPAMGSSQYSDISKGINSRRAGKAIQNKSINPMTAGECIAFLTTAFIICIAVCAVMLYADKRTVCCYDNFWSYLTPLNFSYCVTMIAGYIVGRRDRRQLGGMSGDIAGHMIVMSETVGIAAAALMTGLIY